MALLVSTLVVAFIWTPLGFFAWFGLSHEVMSFREGYRFLAACCVVAFYLLNTISILQTVRSERKWPWATVSYGMWVVGFLGFLTFFKSFSN